MKRLLLIAVFAICMAVTAVASDTVYLSAREGSDSFNGSIGAPFKTLKAAIEAVKDGGTIVVTDRYTLTEFDTTIADVPRFIEPEHSGKITITALAPEYDYRKDGACIYFPDTHGYDASGDLCFENITFESDATVIYFTANFNAVEFGENFDCNNTQGESKKLFLVGGYNCPQSTDLPADKDVNITIKSGKFYRVICFGYQKRGSLSGRRSFRAWNGRYGVYLWSTVGSCNAGRPEKQRRRP